MVASNIKKNIPNIITILRIILVIPIIVLMTINNIGECYQFTINNQIISIQWNSIIVLILFLIASISDWLDGYLSRKYHWTSTFGKILDPIADKILVNSLFILLSVQSKVFVVFTIIFIFRDILIDAIRMYSASKQIIISASWSGKLKTVLQMLSIIMILIIGIDLTYGTLSWWYWAIQNLLIYFALIASITSGIIYITKFIKYNQSSINNGF